MTDPVTQFPSPEDVLAELKAKYPGWEDVKNFSYFPNDQKPATAAIIAAVVNKAVADIAEFNTMPEEERLKFYLKQAMLGLDQICHQSQIDQDGDRPGGMRDGDAQNRLRDIFGIVELLKAQIPSKYKGG